MFAIAKIINRDRLITVVDQDSAGNETQRVEFTYDMFGRRLGKRNCRQIAKRSGIALRWTPFQKTNSDDKLLAE